MRIKIMGKTLIIGWPVRPAQKWLSKYSQLSAYRIYREDLPRIKKLFKDISFHTSKAMQVCDIVTPSHWYAEWKNHVDEYDLVILIDEVRGRDIFEYVFEHNKHCRMCVFYDSPIPAESTRNPLRYSDLPIEFYSCDRKTCREYNVKFMPYFYVFSPYDYCEYEKHSNDEIKQDVFFVGEDKGDRAKQITEIATTLNKAGMTHKLCLIPQKRHGKKKNTYMPYTEVIENVKDSRAILELISAGQTSITQRPYEALFLNKKLITTSAEIKSYDFYHPDNVFILGEQSVDELPAFLSKEFKRIDEKITYQYTLEGWLKRFTIK